VAWAAGGAAVRLDLKGRGEVLELTFPLRLEGIRVNPAIGADRLAMLDRVGQLVAPLGPLGPQLQQDLPPLYWSASRWWPWALRSRTMSLMTIMVPN
jgi:hypothetical protein